MNQFIEIPDYPSYSINVLGLIKRAARTLNTAQGTRVYPEKQIALIKCKTGLGALLYNAENLQQWVSVSKLLLELFGKNRTVHGTIKLYAGHKDSDPFNIGLTNLAWMTKSEIIYAKMARKTTSKT